VRRSRIRTVLETDRPWAAYAMGDLHPPQSLRSTWLLAPDAPALLLLYRGFSFPVLFALGEAAAVAPLLDRIDEPRLYLSVRPEVMPLVRARWRVEEEAGMWRMVLRDRFLAPPASGVELLGPSALPALTRLYEDGVEEGAAGFFEPEILAQGVYYGVWEDEELVSAAGTHLVCPPESVAAVGNVYTRRDRRGRGLATAVTGAVTAELVRQGIGTLVLNVARTNAAALRVYERLGYRRYCPFFEGLAVSPQARG
jgi:ribosomal protein S18 acetylase RimI-like enzyme